jgi:hypothetical protein
MIKYYILQPVMNQFESSFEQFNDYYNLGQYDLKRCMVLNTMFSSSDPQKVIWSFSITWPPSSSVNFYNKSSPLTGQGQFEQMILSVFLEWSILMKYRFSLVPMKIQDYMVSRPRGPWNNIGCNRESANNGMKPYHDHCDIFIQIYKTLGPSLYGFWTPVVQGLKWVATGKYFKIVLRIRNVNEIIIW